MKGKLIVLYGANNLGKSTQVELLEKELREKNIPVKRIKYPIYDLEPTGPQINAVLREGVEMGEEELQGLYAQNRRDFEVELKKMLDDGVQVIAEDYTGTGIAWGLVRGVSLETLEKMNSDLLIEDVAIMLEGERFRDGKEETHRNENDETIWKDGAQKHDMLAKRYGWIRVNANQSREGVHRDIMKILDERGFFK